MNLRATITLSALLLPLLLPASGAQARTFGPPSADQAIVLASEAFQAGDAVKLAKASAFAQGHILQSYLDYWKLKLRIEQAAPEEVRDFLANNAGSLLAEQLRRDWLNVLGMRGDWELYLAEFPRLVNEDPDTTCYNLLARWQQQKDESALAEVRPQWYAARELPQGCTPLAEALLASGQYGPRQVWDRIRLLFDAGMIAPAKRTAAYLPREEALDAKQIDAVNRAPLRHLERASAKPENLAERPARELVILALLKLSKSDPLLAASRWNEKLRDAFPPEDRAYVWSQLALAGARNHLPESLGWYAEVADARLSEEQLAWYVRIALRQENWAEVRAAIGRMSSPQRNEPAWIYWDARALQAQGKVQEARELFARLIDQHQYHFYGLLAADELGQAIVVPPKASPPNAGELAAAAAISGLRRALALYRVDLRSEGTNEWLWAIKGLDDRTLLAAAEFARQNEAWDRAIGTADRTVLQHDFSLRYLAPYREVFAAAAQTLQLEEPWVLGLVRQESRFVTSAKSPAGASGLMQIMPSTAKWMAKKIGMRSYAWARVTEVEVNIRLGTSYLRHVLDGFDGQPVLAAAAYNAGPNRARKWRDLKPLEGAIFTETIPFGETRDYVKKVMANTVYYAAAKGDTVRSLKMRLGVIPARAAGDRVLAMKDEAAQ